MEQRLFEILQQIAGREDDPRRNRLLQHFGCANVSLLMCRLWTSDADTKQQMQAAIVRIVKDPELDAPASTASATLA